MLNKPKFMSPSINMYGNSVIDLNSATLPFSCIVDGNEAVTHFQIVISRLKDNVTVFDTGLIDISNKPFFPINNRNQNVVFSRNLKDYNNTISGENKFVNSADAYYWNITFKNSNSGTETYSAAEVFYANSVPKTVVSCSYKDDFSNLFQDFDKIQKRKIYFKSTYSQAEGISLKRYGWRLTDIINDSVIMDTISQNQIYGVADDISCVCNGLTNNTRYRLELYIETQNGYFDVLQSIDVYVDYPVEPLEADFEVTPLNDTAGIMLNWRALKTTEGVVVGEPVGFIETVPTTESSSAKIPYGGSIVFSSISSSHDLEIDENSYVVISFQFDKLNDIKLFEMSGEDEYSNNMIRRLEYIREANKFKYTVIKGDILATCEASLDDTPSDLCWYVVTLHPMVNESVDFKVALSVAENVPYPLDDKYPHDDRFPSLGEWGLHSVL